MISGFFHHSIDRVRTSFWQGTAIVFLTLIAASAAHASRNCLHGAGAEGPPLVQDRAGCWTHGTHLPRPAAPSVIPEMIIVLEEPDSSDPLPDFLTADEGVATMMNLFVLFASAVLMTASGFAAWRPHRGPQYHRAASPKSW